MNTRETTYNYRLNQWTAIIRECRSSGQSVSAWCADHDINNKSYYYWIKRVREAACEALPALTSGSSPIVPVNIPVSETVTDSVNQGTSSDIILHLGTVTLELSNSASALLIENTLKAIQNVR
jgi:transposase-like protein